MTAPGGPVSCTGVTVVGVLPTHRRRGILDRMMRAQLAAVRERGEPLAACGRRRRRSTGASGMGWRHRTR
ncbi:MAG: GNAT family N-acetyltransferase [Thermoleophilia bacterium]|nr:GNAT family N-acetyltransferase [Thermoleophilia bacterium]